MSLALAASMSGGELIGEDRPVTGVCSDTRSLAPGELYVALKGERFDGHEFIDRARVRGAAGAIVSKPVDTALPIIQLDNTLTGLQRLAARWREQFDLPLVAITGSNGKTTVKELTGAILRQASDCVLITRGNLNNHIGVPLTLLKLTGDHEYAVIEMGMNHAGEISLLTGLARPTVALVNNAMQAHVEDLGSIEAVARAKGEIFEGLADDGIAILNADDANLGLWKQLIGERAYLDFALDAPAAVTARPTYTAGHTLLDVSTPVGQFECRLNLLGRHNVLNALAAVAVCCALEVGTDAMALGIESVAPVKGRLKPVNTADGILILDDTYNANPGSMMAGIDVLAQLPGIRKILVAGDMGELGEQAGMLHRQTGEYARDRNIDCFLSLGPLMAGAASAFGKTGFNTGELDELLGALDQVIGRDAIVLVKGSRSMRMERVVDALLARTGEVN